MKTENLQINPSILPHSANQVGLTSPAWTLESSETTRTMAKIIVMTPTLKAPPMLIFSTVFIWRFHSKRIGMDITSRCE